MKRPNDRKKSKWIFHRINPLAPVLLESDFMLTDTDSDRSEAAILRSSPKVPCPVQCVPSFQGHAMREIKVCKTHVGQTFGKQKEIPWNDKNH